MWLTEVSIRRPLFILMVILGFVLVGAVAYTRLGADRYPSINLPYVTIIVTYPGAGPEEVEDQVTRPLEDAVAGANQLKSIRSYSMDSVSIVSLEFLDGANADSATTEVERKVNSARSQLPSDAKPPIVVKAEYSSLPVMSLAISGDLPLDQIHKIANETIKPRMETIKGVAAISIVGGLEREIQVRVDQDKLGARGLTTQQVYGALAQGNLSMPAGSIHERDREYSIRYTGLFQSLDELKNSVVAASPRGVVYLRDVADVVDAYKDRKVINRYNGREGVGLVITKQANANTVQVADSMKKALGQIQKSLPPGVMIAISDDQSSYVKRSLGDVQNNLFEAVVLTGIVLLVFLHTFRSTVIVMLAIPTSLISTFLMMWIMGFTLNFMSLMALALTIGILVDDSIVVLENIFRHLKLGETPVTAAIKGRSEIGLAAIAITLVDVVVYLPMAFMTGIVGGFFRQFGLTITVATLFSLFVSFTLTPMLASRWLGMGHGEGHSPLDRFGRRWESWFERLSVAYGGALKWALGHRVIVAAASLLLFFCAIALIPLNILGSEFLPAEDQSQFDLIAKMPPGTSLEATDQAMMKIESRLNQFPEVTEYFTTVGQGSVGFSSSSESRAAFITVKLVPKDERSRGISKITRAAEKLGEDVPGLELRTQLPTIGGPMGQPLMIQLKGDDLRQLGEAGARLEQIIRSIPGTASVTNSAEVGNPEIRVRADQWRLSDLGLTSAQVAAALRTNVEGMVASQLRPEGQTKVDIRILGGDRDRGGVGNLGTLPLASPKGFVATVDQATDISLVQGPTQILRFNRQRSVTIGADVSGRPLGDVVRDLRLELERSPLPEGVTYSMTGETEIMDESFSNLIMALALSILFMYMLMVALYESLLYPLVVMFCLPVAVIGALGGLLVTGQTVNMSSLIGMIMLMGLVGKNGILLVDYTNTLRARGKDRFSALTEAGPTRLRPIMMTTTAMALAMLPVALGLGEGAEVRSPMAVVVVGGLLSSLVLTLLLIPVVYTAFDDLQQRFRPRKVSFRTVASATVVEGSNKE
ncbi:MAG: efflux RND transporter permease subunit [Chloroflexi bacterium]|nr:efflux RND transporter permease subunit [Chloroflexota bacterium]